MSTAPVDVEVKYFLYKNNFFKKLNYLNLRDKYL